MSEDRPTPYRWRWHWWLILPLVWFNFVVALLLGAPLSNLYLLYPDRRAHIYDARGNLHQRKRLAQWRNQYQRLTLRERIQRAMLVRSRRRRNREFRLHQS
jgi:hypothetical protein